METPSKFDKKVLLPDSHQWHSRKQIRFTPTQPCFGMFVVGFFFAFYFISLQPARETDKYLLLRLPIKRTVFFFHCDPGFDPNRLCSLLS